MHRASFVILNCTQQMHNYNYISQESLCAVYIPYLLHRQTVVICTVMVWYDIVHWLFIIKNISCMVWYDMCFYDMKCTVMVWCDMILCIGWL